MMFSAASMMSERVNPPGATPADCDRLLAEWRGAIGVMWRNERLPAVADGFSLWETYEHWCSRSWVNKYNTVHSAAGFAPQPAAWATAQEIARAIDRRCAQIQADLRASGCPVGPEDLFRPLEVGGGYRVKGQPVPLGPYVPYAPIATASFAPTIKGSGAVDSVVVVDPLVSFVAGAALGALAMKLWG